MEKENKVEKNKEIGALLEAENKEENAEGKLNYGQTSFSCKMVKIKGLGFYVYVPEFSINNKSLGVSITMKPKREKSELFDNYTLSSIKACENMVEEWKEKFKDKDSLSEYLYNTFLKPEGLSHLCNIIFEDTFKKDNNIFYIKFSLDDIVEKVKKKEQIAYKKYMKTNNEIKKKIGEIKKENYFLSEELSKLEKENQRLKGSVNGNNLYKEEKNINEKIVEKKEYNLKEDNNENYNNYVSYLTNNKNF